MVWVRVQLHDHDAVPEPKFCWIDWVGFRIHWFTGVVVELILLF